MKQRFRTLFADSPAQALGRAVNRIHLGRWCLATVTSVAGSSPAWSASSG